MVTLRSLLWSTLSSTPVTITVCAVLQLVALKVKVAGFTVATPSSPDATATSTLAVGRLASTTV